MNTVLVVDDKEMMRDSVGTTLRRAGFDVQTATDGPAAVAQVAQRRPDAVVTDLRMPGMTGLELLAELRSVDDDLPVIVMTAYGAVDTAVRAIKAGAFDYLTKPFEGDELIVAVKRAIEHARLVRENAVLRAGSAAPGSDSTNPDAPDSAPVSGLDRLIGDSPAMRRVREQVRAVAESGGTVLVYGESGTGKEVVAHAVHELSPRRDRPFLAVNCAALSESLLESELFGHERGAFTGAEKLRKGRFELADGGTILLDEITEISTRVQAKLLRVLQERQFERVGSSVSIGLDVRVVATSNRDLPRAVARGEFRQDLFFRLNVLPVHLPPLRDRLEDVPALAAHFLRRAARRDARPAREFTASALETLSAYPWPGNVRELQNICERAAVLSKDPSVARDLIEPWLNADAARAVSAHPNLPAPSTLPQPAGVVEPKPIPFNPTSPPFAPNSANPIAHATAPGEPPHANGHALPVSNRAVSVEGRLLEDIERDAIVLTLQKFNGHRQRAARSLGIGVRTLGLKLKKWKELQLVEPTL